MSTYFTNNKPWVSRQLKICLNERKVAFCYRNTELLCVKRRQLRGEILKAKLDFKTKIEGIFLTGNVRQAWEGLSTLMGRSNKKDNSSVRNCQTFINDLNIFIVDSIQWMSQILWRHKAA